MNPQLIGLALTGAALAFDVFKTVRKRKPKRKSAKRARRRNR